jgi:hypothetical protein
MATFLKYQNGLLVPANEKLPANRFTGRQPNQRQVQHADRFTSGRIGNFAKAVIAMNALLSLTLFLLIA